MTGKIRDIKIEKGFGFIMGEDGAEYFFHRSAIRDAKWTDLEAEQTVEFQPGDSPKGLRAEQVYVR